MANYQSPCDKCKYDKNGACERFRRCAKWLTRYRYRQKQINAYAQKLGIEVGKKRMDGDWNGQVQRTMSQMLPFSSLCIGVAE